MNMMKKYLLAGFGFILCVMGAAPSQHALAQGLFSSVVTINDQIVTRYQLDQRAAFLTLLGIPENAAEVALSQLTNEALQLQAARAAGFAPTPEQIEAGQTEFAGRANLTRDQFIAALQQNGVQPETFNDFVAAGVAWGSYVRERFRPEAEVLAPGALEQALLSAELAPDRRVLLSEIILPANSPDARRISQARAESFRLLTSEEEFGAAAAEFSLANTRLNNGEVEWRPLSALPEPIQQAVSNLQPGQVSRTVDLGNAIAVFFLRDAENSPATGAAFASVDYARLQLPPGAESRAAEIASRLDRCEDLLAEASAFSETAFVRETTLLNALPADVAAIVDTLDGGEVSTSLRRGGAPVVVMLCQRTFGDGAEVDPSAVRVTLINQRLQLLANRHLAEIRDSAIVVRANGG